MNIGCVAHWHFLLNELRPHQCVRLGFRSETSTCETPTNLTVDGYSAQAQAFKCFNCTQTDTPAVFIVMLLTAKENYLNQACTDFEPESPVSFKN